MDPTEGYRDSSKDREGREAPHTEYLTKQLAPFQESVWNLI